MGMRNYFKKLGKRSAGVWGRINHKRDMRAASKAIRRMVADGTITEFETEEEICKDFELWLEEDSIKDLYLLNDEEPH